LNAQPTVPTRADCQCDDPVFYGSSRGFLPHVTLTVLNSDSHSLAEEVSYRVSHQPCSGRV
jgi:hypothetical protein